MTEARAAILTGARARPRHALTLAHSPDSDDMVMWWPLTGMIGPDGAPVEGPGGRPAIDTGRFAFRTFAEDIERLNQRAIEQADLDITAISAHTYPHVAERYCITCCGASLGDGYGPKVVVLKDSPIHSLGGLACSGVTIAVPGVRTTAWLTLSILARPDLAHEEMLFSDVAGAVATERCGAGLLIHEAQLDFEAAGLRQVADLGAAWKSRTGLPLPLGLNVIKRDLSDRFGPGSMLEVTALLQLSIHHARTHPDAARRFLRLHGAGRPEWSDDALLDEYMAMYVNDDTVDMGERGEQALQRLYAEAHAAGLCPDPGSIDVLRP